MSSAPVSREWRFKGQGPGLVNVLWVGAQTSVHFGTHAHTRLKSRKKFPNELSFQNRSRAAIRVGVAQPRMRYREALDRVRHERTGISDNLV